MISVDKVGGEKLTPKMISNRALTKIENDFDREFCLISLNEGTADGPL